MRPVQENVFDLSDIDRGEPLGHCEQSKNPLDIAVLGCNVLDTR